MMMMMISEKLTCCPRCVNIGVDTLRAGGCRMMLVVRDDGVSDIDGEGGDSGVTGGLILPLLSALIRFCVASTESIFIT